MLVTTYSGTPTVRRLETRALCFLVGEGGQRYHLYQLPVFH